MLTYRTTLISVLVVCMLLASLSPTTAQNPPATGVAILVVDVFEALPNQQPLLRDSFLPEDSCVVSPSGMDGAFWDGGTAGKLLTSALYPGAPHGRLVYTELRHLVDPNDGPPPIPGTDGQSEFETPWIREIERWPIVGGNQIVLVAVDTGDYKLETVLDHIESAINLLTNGPKKTLQDVNISRVVVNMSFGLIPCQNFPDLSLEDYEHVLEAFAERFPNDYVPGFEVSYTDLLNEFLELKGGLDPSSPSFTFLLDDDRFAELRSAVTWSRTYPRLLKTFYPYYRGAPDSWIANVELMSAFHDPAPDAVFVASAGNDTHEFPYYPALATGVVSVSAEYSKLLEPACSGVLPENNRGAKIALLQDLIEELRSDETFGAGLERDEVDAVIDWAKESLLDPPSNSREVRSNWGEVLMNGVSAIHVDPILGCLRGTSFAAPRLSYEQAIYALNNGSRPCGGTLGESDPPLDHDQWDNLDRTEAATRYCDDFNALVGPGAP